MDLDRLTGTGMGNAITLDDVLRAADAPKVAAAEPTHDMRQVIARAMSRSKREIPHYYLSVMVGIASSRERM